MEPYKPHKVTVQTVAYQAYVPKYARVQIKCVYCVYSTTGCMCRQKIMRVVTKRNEKYRRRKKNNDRRPTKNHTHPRSDDVWAKGAGR